MLDFPIRRFHLPTIPKSHPDINFPIEYPPSGKHVGITSMHFSAHVPFSLVADFSFIATSYTSSSIIVFLQHPRSTHYTSSSPSLAASGSSPSTKMPPKPALLTELADNAQKKKAPSCAITTQEKIPRAEAKKDNMEKTAREASKTSRPAKPRALPPPGDAFRDIEPRARKKPGKPVTTKEKIEAAEAAKKAKDVAQAASKSKSKEDDGGSGVDATARKSKGKPAKFKGPAMLSVLKYHDASAIQYEKKRKGGSMLVRPTERAKRWKAEHLELAKTVHDGGVFRLMDLPKELQMRIWRFAVIYPRFFVWPESVTGREQPDLTMVCKEVRREVLPIYYEKNTFAIDVSRPQTQTQTQTQPFRGNQSVVKKIEPVKSVTAMEKWAECLEMEAEWFYRIRNWAFSYTPETATRAKRLAEVDNSFVVFFKTWKRNGQRTWDASVEVHRDAHCILARFEECGLCKLQQTPKWLQHEVIEILDAATGKNVTPVMIVGLAKAIQRKTAELVGARCEEVEKSIESDRGTKASKARAKECRVMRLHPLGLEGVCDC